MKKTILMLSITLAGGLLVTNVYNSLIDATSWGSDIPNSIATARAYYKHVNPGNFYRVFSPLNQALGLLALVLFWKRVPQARALLGAAFVLYVLCDAFTFGYFYPRNEIMFTSAGLQDVELLRKTWAEWDTMNWVRSAMLAVGVGLAFRALHLAYTAARPKAERAAVMVHEEAVIV